MRLPIFLLLLAVLLPLPSHAGGKSLDFALIQPGQPGSPAEAEPVLSAFSSYLEKRLGGGIAVRGTYLNDLEAARKALAKGRPAWGIVTLGVYAQEPWTMTPIASTRPGGADREQWRLLAPGAAPKEWRQVKGPVRGTVLQTKEAGACLLFGTELARLPFRLEGTAEPLKALRAAASGQGAAVVDEVQWKALQKLPLLRKLSVAHTSPEIPTSPVVWFGTPGPEAERLAKVLLGMGEDPEAAGLLRLLQTEGFGPPENDLSKWKISDDRCPG